MAKSHKQNGHSKTTNGNGNGHLAQEEEFDDETDGKDRILREKEAELKRMQEMLAQMQAKMQQAQQ